MIVDITNEVLTKIRTDIPTVTVLSSYQPSNKTYPLIVVTENGNISHQDTIDSSGEKHNEVALEINIFTIGETKMSDAKTLRNSVDTIMSGHYRMNRDFANEVPNYLDADIYRYTIRYSCIVDSNQVIFGR